jgi:hypothetical protein
MPATYEKIILSGGVIEVTTYEKLNTKGGGARDGDGEHKQENYKQTQRRRRNKIRQLICSNFDNHSKFVTLTFNNSMDFDIKDVKQCNAAFKNFIKRLKYKFPELKYIAVLEFQDKNDRGAVHYHMICNLPYIRKVELSEIWDSGFVKINAIDKVDNVGAYVIKYMNKDIDDVRLQGLKAYNSSQGLVQPYELRSWDVRISDMELREQLYALMKEISPSYATTYESENAGTIEYRQYNLTNLNQMIARKYDEVN